MCYNTTSQTKKIMKTVLEKERKPKKKREDQIFQMKKVMRKTKKNKKKCKCK